MHHILKKMRNKLSDRHYHHVIKGFFLKQPWEINSLNLVLSLAYQNEIVKKGGNKLKFQNKKARELHRNSPAEKIFLFISDQKLPSQP